MEENSKWKHVLNCWYIHDISKVSLFIKSTNLSFTVASKQEVLKMNSAIERTAKFTNPKIDTWCSLWSSPKKQRQNGHFSDILSLALLLHYQGNTIVRAAAAVEIQFCMVLVCNSSLLSMVKWNTMPHTHENHVHHEQVGGQATIELLYSPHGPGNL